MTALIELLGKIRARGVTLSLDGNSLKCSAPPGILTPELRAELSQQKPAIIAFLRASKKPSQAAEPALIRIDRTGPLPLSYAQQRLWFLNQLDPESTVYNIATACRFSGAVDVYALEKAIREIIRRHESLRTCFSQVNGVPQCFIRDEVDWSLNVIDARDPAQQESRGELMPFVTSLARQHLDITRAPLIRAHLVRIGEENHILVFVLHHIIFDGWSLGVLTQELTELYLAFASGTQPELAPLKLQYVDFAAWQRKWLESGELDRQLSYWKKQLAGSPPVVTFPPDRRRPATELFHGARSKLVISRELTSQLRAISQRHGATLFMALLAVFKVLLARYTGQDDIVVGSASANRGKSELYPMMGFFVNNLVLRTDLSGNPMFSELLSRVREVTQCAYEHQDVPFDRLVHALHTERSLDHSPLFQTMFVLQNYPIEKKKLPGVAIEPLELAMETARFDLTVEAFPDEEALKLFFDYNTDLYSAETIARLQGHYLTVLEAIAADSDVKIGAIPLLSASEREKLLFDGNKTAAEIPSGVCFHQRFTRHAAATPDRVAVIAGDSAITYSELNQKADRIAAALRARGAGPEKLVAIFEERGVDLIAAMLGVSKSGAAYIPLDPGYPKARIQNILEDGQPVAIVTSKQLLESLPETDAQILCLDELGNEAQSSGGPDCATQNNLAYVIFTSGSTGRPKGVQITHLALLNFLESMQKEPGLSAADVLLAVTTVSFDIAGLELLLPLYVGATVCVSLQPRDPASLLRDVERYRPTVMQATPATWKLLVAAGWQGDASMKILCGGEAMEPALAQSLLVRCDMLWNMYGPTETTIWSAALLVRKTEGEAIPIGHPIQNTSFYVLDALGQPVPRGVIGELWIGGEGLARGYLNRPELTAEKFQLCPWAAKSGARMYRTGDMVRYRSDGTLDFHGRADHQVKFRGFRIELAEIENALRSFEGVTDAVVLLRNDDDEKRLVAYLTHCRTEFPSRSIVRDHLRQSLPEYMLPTAFVFLEEFPRLPNGKLDRSSLPRPERSTDSGSPAFTAPAGALQQTIAGIFQNVLGVDRVGVDDNFFDLGAHSLQMVRVHADLNQLMAKPIPLISLFQYPNIRALSASIGRSGGEIARVADVVRG